MANLLNSTISLIPTKEQEKPYDAEVDYLAKLLYEYTDLKISPTLNTGIYVEFTPVTLVNIGSTQSNCVFCCGEGKYPANNYQGFGINFQRNYVRCYYNSQIDIVTNIRPYNKIVATLNFLNDKKFTVNGESKDLPSPVNLTNRSIYLFGAHTTLAYDADFGARNARIHRFIVTESDKVIMDLIPVRKDGVGYFYDKVSGKLFGNDAPELGNELTPSEYIIGQDKQRHYTSKYDREINYASSDVESLIDTGINFENISKVKITATFATRILKNNAGNVSNNNWQVIGHTSDVRGINFGFHTPTNRFTYCYGSGQKYIDGITPVMHKMYTFEMDMVNGTFTIIDADSGEQLHQETFESSNHQVQQNFYLFGYYDTTPVMNRIDLSKCDIWYDGEHIGDYVPVIKDEITYIYDKITDKLIRSTGPRDLSPFYTIEQEKPYDAEIEYLESDGNQYIDASFVPIEWMPFEIIYQNNGRTAPGYGLVFGQRYSSGSNAYGLANYINCSIFIGNKTTSNLIKTDLYEKHHIRYGYGSVQIDDDAAVSVTVAATYPYFSVYMFCWAEHRNPVQKQAGRIYYAKFDNVREFIPVRKDGVGYFYDKVSGKLFGNKGTGAFILGPDKL